MPNNKTRQLPLVSIIIPTYNRPEYIKKAIDSVLPQTYRNIEIIIIDGSSNNETEKIIRPCLVDHRIHYIRREDSHTGSIEDRGLIARARNRAVRIAKGKYIAVLDDDDFWCDEKKLEKQVQFLENHPNYVACGGGTVVIREEEPQKPIFSLPLEKDEDIKKNMLLLGGMCGHSTLVFRKSAWEAVGGYDEEYPLNEDADFYFKLGRIGKLYNFPEYFSCFLLGEQNKVNFTKLEKACLRYNIQLKHRYRKDYPDYPKAIFLAWVYYLYSFLPFGKLIRPLVKKIKQAIFDLP